MHNKSKLIHADRVPLSVFEAYEAWERNGCIERTELSPAAQRRENIDAQRRARREKREQSLNEFRRQFAPWLKPGVDLLADYMRTHK